ncbi:GlxA family transcriptional regulator [Sulfitobacter sp. M57]|uniref:GlxA family transcriptional regulator n=1 Tax=unclassified Sulfitobacter TaxID=196795 RepID=UPI0023E0B518|nr:MULTISPECIES: GlxA family transcriptional regulator [unclassified Sulfitobacter]MDF3416099.1 GlxA family transcriptional regulator [Sulfitobacter sp. KE5]MDF3423578.1 GlxA family transcriptional regulator [Sulfitobacter sp. KE43]MDF3434620.1 GlxA family transcriptional regulator [Sulfitobacter sp. KE42]MDF3460284.1 GlxA family transcriptional regulator [Sulfitobacter sp. S74]MDF3464158.1 GlxA family transcriptional regulator [Sulfitobacter sp. Ks18]
MSKRDQADLDRPDLVPAGAFSYPVKNPKPTRWFGFLLLPQFTLLAFSAALDPLRIANQLAQKPLYGWSALSQDGKAVTSSSGIDIDVQAGIADLAADTYLFVCSGNNGTKVAPENLLGQVRRHARFGGKVGGICTGAATLARAGLLGGKRFTLHWENQPGFIEAFPDLEPTPQRFEEDGTLLTCGGGVAATEMMISIIAKDYGEDFAIAVSDMCLNGPDVTTRVEQRSSIAKAISSRNPRVLAVLRAMYENIENPLTLDELATHAGISRRQIERQFRQLLDEAPAQTYRNIRLDRARSLLMETDLSVEEIAVAAGFNARSLFSRHYKERYGETPYGHRGRIRDSQIT